MDPFQTKFNDFHEIGHRHHSLATTILLAPLRFLCTSIDPSAINWSFAVCRRYCLQMVLSLPSIESLTTHCHPRSWPILAAEVVVCVLISVPKQCPMDSPVCAGCFQTTFWWRTKLSNLFGPKTPEKVPSKRNFLMDGMSKIWAQILKKWFPNVPTSWRHVWTSNCWHNGCSTLRKAEDLMPRDIRSS